MTCTYDLKNVGDIALKPMGNMDDIVVDDKCSPVAYAGSPDAELEPGDAWSFSCDQPRRGHREHRNRDPRAGQQANQEQSVTDVAFVHGTGAEIKIVKSADRPVVCKREDVNYTYSVTNPGQVPLADVTVTDDVSVRSPVRTPGGTRTTTVCWTRWSRSRRGIAPTLLTQTTTNTGTATGTPTLPNRPPGRP